VCDEDINFALSLFGRNFPFELCEQRTPFDIKSTDEFAQCFKEGDAFVSVSVRPVLLTAFEAVVMGDTSVLGEYLDWVQQCDHIRKEQSQYEEDKREVEANRSLCLRTEQHVHELRHQYDGNEFNLAQIEIERLHRRSELYEKELQCRQEFLQREYIEVLRKEKSLMNHITFSTTDLPVMSVLE
jgi:hypothetical protein